MKVLMINSVCGIGSTGRICADLASALDKQGNSCLIAYGRNGYVPQEYRKYAVRIGSDFDVRRHAMLTRITDRHGFYSKRSTQNFIDRIRDYNPDIIHLHNIHGYYINIEYLFNYLRELCKPVIWTLHDCWSFTGHCAHYDYIKCDKWKNGCSKCSQKTRYPQSLICDNSKNNWIKKKNLFNSISNLLIVTPSQWLADEAAKSYLGHYDIRVVNNGIDLSVFHPTNSNFREKYGLKDKTILLGVSSVWDERKGFNDFINLSKILPSKYKIVLVGVSSAQIQKIPKEILAIEHTESQKQLAEIYSASDVFLNLTYEDTFPTVNLEALACGTPVVSYNSGGSAEIIRKFGGGIVLDSKTPEAVKENIGRATAIKPEDCLKHTCKFDSLIAQEKYLKIYTDLYKKYIG
ncbi:MAG: glycosyltransferase [Ruminococcus sp.]|nr:glycosyltransferase [Ruminococcus sp.]